MLLRIIPSFYVEPTQSELSQEFTGRYRIRGSDSNPQDENLASGRFRTFYVAQVYAAFAIEQASCVSQLCNRETRWRHSSLTYFGVRK